MIIQTSIYLFNIIGILYILNQYQKMDIFKEKIDFIISPEGLYLVKVITTLFVLILFYFIYKLFKNISKKLNMNIIHLWITFLIIFIIWVNYKLETNHKISNQKKNIEEVLKDCNSYDIVLFRSYHSYDIPELFFYRWFHSLISDYYCGHIGIIYKEDGKTYVIESTESFYKSLFDHKKKNGVILNDFTSYVENYDGNIFIIHNNIHKYKSNKELYNIALKKKNHSFNEKGMSCVGLIKYIFQELDLFFQNEYFLLPYSFTQKEKYKINYENLGVFCLKKYHETPNN
jgi:hypothetical protein